MNIKLMNGHVLDMLKSIPDESIDCIVSSCPYYGLRDYSGVASYASEDYHELLRTANADIQKHRDRVLESQKEKYYLTEPVFNKKDKKWYISLNYDISSVWGGDPECEHEWTSQHNHKDNLRFRDPNHIASVGNNKHSEIYSNPTVLSGTCTKCGAWKGQIGLENSYKEYTEHLMLVMKELKRVLKKTGTLFWNMGDTYSGAGVVTKDTGKASYEASDFRQSPVKSNLPNKSLMMIPERLAMAMIDDGWILRNSIIWYKRNGMPSSVKDRLSNKWEYVFFFTKSQKYYFDLDSIRRPLAESSIKRISQKNIPKQFKSGKSVEFAETNPVNNIPKIMNNMHQKYQQEESYQGSHSGYCIEDGSLRANLNGANPGDVLFDDTIYDPYTDPNIWDAFMEYLERERPELLMPSILDIPTRSHKFAHFAVMPETLIDPLIKVGCPSEVCVKCGKPKTMEYKREIDMENEKSSLGNQDNGIKRQRSRWVKLGVKPSCKCNADFEPGKVLDPFAGSGTVGVVAKKQGKSAILIEISPEYVEIIKNRLEIADSGTNINANIEVASVRKLEEFEIEVKI